MSAIDATATERRAQLRAIAESYFEGMAKKDMSAVPWDDHVSLRSPLAPGGLETPLVGKPAVLGWFTALYSVLGEVNVIEHYINEEATVIATRADVGITSPPTTLRVVDRFTVNTAGKIVAQENHYDPRAVTSPPAHREIAQSYFDGLRNKDMSQVPWADDATLRAPLNPEGPDALIVGKDNILAFFDGILPNLGAVEVLHHYVDGNMVAMRVDVEVALNPPVILRVVDCFRIENGQIVEQTNHFDPRAALASMTS